MNERRENQGEPSPRREIHSRSLAATHLLLDRLLTEHEAGRNPMVPFDLAHPMIQVAEIEARQQGVSAYATWARRLEQLGQKNFAANLYVKAAYELDVDSRDRLVELLDEERENPQQRAVTGGQLRRVGPVMDQVLQASAASNTPADVWIERYRVNVSHADEIAEMKLRYYDHQVLAKKGEELPEGSVGVRYRDEVTAQFLSGQGLTREYAITIANRLWQKQEDPNIRGQVVRRLEAAVSEGPLTEEMYTNVLRLLNNVLKSQDDLPADQAAWMSDFAYSGILQVEGAAPSLFEDEEETTLRILLAYKRAEDLDDVVGFIEDLAEAGLPATDRADRTDDEDAVQEDLIFRAMDTQLSKLAFTAADAGKFKDAKYFLSNMGSPDRIRRAEISLSHRATTLEDLELFAPDEFTVLVDPQAGQAYEERKVLVEGDPDKVKALAHAKIAAITPDAGEIFDIREATDECISVLRKQDIDVGIELRKDLLKQLETVGADPGEIASYAVENIKELDDESLQLLYRSAARQGNPNIQVGIYAALAHETAPEEGADRNADLRIKMAEVRAQVQPEEDRDGAFVIEPEEQNIQDSDEQRDETIVTFPTSEGQIPLFPEENNDREQDNDDRDER
jgi:hypothetical protein